MGASSLGEVAGKVPEPADATQWCNATVRCNGAPEHVLARTCGRRPASSVSVFGIARPDQGNREIGRATSELQSLMRISYAVFCLKTNRNHTTTMINVSQLSTLTLYYHKYDKQILTN